MLTKLTVQQRIHCCRGYSKEDIVEELLYQCPFCGEDDFDLIGLKTHLENYCKVYDNTPTIPCLFGR